MAFLDSINHVFYKVIKASLKNIFIVLKVHSGFKVKT